MALNTCLFIREFFEESKVYGDLLSTTRKVVNGGSFEDYRKAYWNAIDLILDAAKKSEL